MDAKGTHSNRGVKRKLDPTETPASSQNFKPEYHTKWPCLTASQKGQGFVFCTLCRSDFSCAHGGSFDCKRHVERKSHVKIAKICNEKQSKLQTFFKANEAETSHEETMQRRITQAELTMCEIIAEANCPLTLATTLSGAFKTMFSDSKIAEGFKCSRDKATVFIKELAVNVQNGIVDRMKRGAYTISTDGSNDVGSKQFPIVVRSWNSSTGAVSSELLSIPVMEESATGKNIFDLVDNVLEKNSIPWKNCLSLGCDNASVMTGNKKGVVVYMKEKQPHLFLSGCTLHAIHNAAKKATKTALPSIDDALVDVYYYLDKSSKRLQRLKKFQELCSVEQKKILKHVCTRWLSISKCLKRFIENLDALKLFFKEEKDSMESSKNKADYSSYAKKKINDIFYFIRSPTNKLYCLFLVYTYEVFDEVLVQFQAEAPKIHLLRRSLLRLIRNIMSRFVKPCAMIGKDIEAVDYKSAANIKDNTEFEIGEAARQFINDRDIHHLRDSRLAEFYKNVLLFFQTLLDYLLKKLPLKEPVLVHAEVADPYLQTTSKSSSLRYFIERFPCLLPTGASLDCVLGQFCSYQTENISSHLKERLDETWHSISQIQNEEGQCNYRELAAVMSGIITIPHSSAHCERIFSCVRKNHTDQRPSLSDVTLENLLVLKSSSQCLGKTLHSNEFLDYIKGAYYRHVHKQK